VAAACTSIATATGALASRGHVNQENAVVVISQRGHSRQTQEGTKGRVLNPSGEPCSNLPEVNSRSQVNIAAGNHPITCHHRPNQLPVSSGEPKRGPDLKIYSQNTNDTLTTVTISTTPSTRCQHYFQPGCARMLQSLICWILTGFPSGFTAYHGPCPPRPGLTG
jgi:hypothetical protein